ncbi:MAG: CBS domain-containing protein [Dehalococcoidia bacterium]
MTGDSDELPGGPPSEEEANAITRGTSVGEALGRVGISGCVVREEADLVQVAEVMAACLGTHTVAVVDDDGRLVGIIPMRLLLDELYLHVAPEEFLVGMRASKDIEEFGKISRAHKAKELMQHPVYVTLGDSVRKAFVKMHENKLEGLPVVDEEMRVLGYLDRLQLMRLWLEKHRKWARPGPGQTGPRQEAMEGGV